MEQGYIILHQQYTKQNPADEHYVCPQMEYKKRRTHYIKTILKIMYLIKYIL